MQKKLTVLFAFAIFVLVVGWAVTPAQAHCKKDKVTGEVDAHCNKGDSDDVPTLATLNFGRLLESQDLEGGMDYPEVLNDRMQSITLPPFTVWVGMDSSKKIRFGNSEFDISDPNNLDIDGIMMDFGIDPGFPALGGPMDCVAHNGAAMEAQQTVLGRDLLEAMGDELNTADITSGFFEAQIDRKNDTGFIIFEYMSEIELLNKLGSTLIIVGSHDSPPVVEGPDDTFTLSGSVVTVRQSTPGGAKNDLFINCTVNHDPEVVLILKRP